jgi:hypothetical protein
MKQRPALSAAFFLLSLSAMASAQSTGTVIGRVLDQTSLPIPNVSVELLTAGSQEHIPTLTGDDGIYRFEGVPTGPAELTLKLINFLTVRRTVTVAPGNLTVPDITMVVTSSADITVTAPYTFRNLAELDNPAENLVGVAASSSEGAITAQQLENRAIMRAGEVLETVPGMIVSQHSGEGKANQYYLRGFNLDHGFDFATTVAGVPVNMPTHGHAHGYADANFLIPELVSGLQFRKGPYFAEIGDFSTAGSANVNYFNSLDRPFAVLSGGGDGWGRFVGAASPRLGPGHLLVAAELNHNNGPWVRADHFHKANGVVRYTEGDARNGFSVTGMAYSANWNATDQIPERAISSGLISRYGGIDNTDRGKSFRYSIAGDGQWSGVRDSTRLTGYVLRYGLNLVQNFTYFLDDPIDGDQREQEDRRWVTGARITHRRMGELGRFHHETAIGGEFRHDAIGDLSLFRTVGGDRRSTIRTDVVGQTSYGAFAQTEIEWSRIVRTTFGIRGDMFHYDVESDNPANSGQDSTGVLSPKASAVLGPWKSTEFYVNAGLGFHSNNALGATLTVDPVTGDPADRATPIVHAEGAEIGFRTVALRGLQSTLSLWTLSFDHELLFVGDAGTTEAGRPSRRYGIEWTNYYAVHPWVTLDFDLSLSRARFTDDAPEGNFIPGALDRVISAGFAIEPPEEDRGFLGNLRLRHFGPRPLVEDKSVNSKSTSIVNTDIGYRFNERFSLVGEIFNVFDAEAADIDYFYTSRLPGEPIEGVEDIHTHPALPRSARIILRVSF